MPAPDPQHKASVQQTLQALDGTAADTSLASLSGLGIPQVRDLKREIAEIFPASNLPAFLLQGLLQLKGRTLDRDRVAGDLRVLFRETGQIGVYSTFLAAPALIIFGYQRLLTLAGKDMQSAFPDGTWQFYTEFGLREDAARHTVETVGFQRAAPDLSEADAAACWVAAAMHTLSCYDELLANEWHERMSLRCVELALIDAATTSLGRLPKKGQERNRLIAAAVEELRAAAGIEHLAADWAARRPYHGPPADPLDGYTIARRRAFETFLDERLRRAPDSLRQGMRAHYDALRPRELPAFLSQMTLHQTLLPESYSERRTPIESATATVALICGGAYHLIDLYERDGAGVWLITPRDGDPARPGQPLSLERRADGSYADRYGRRAVIDRLGHVRVDGARIGRLRRRPLAEILAQTTAALRADRPLPIGVTGEAPPTDLLLAAAPRNRQEQLRGMLNAQSRDEIAQLRRAPIMVNWDRHRGNQPLGQIRRTRRGVGDHALTIIRTDGGIIFDMSHIFFDGAWGSALAEMITGFAVAVARQIGAVRPAKIGPPPRLNLGANRPFLNAAGEAAANTPAEVSAESDQISLTAMNGLRRRLAEREIELTVNDLLVLARYAHAADYRPGPAAMAALDDLATREGEGSRLARQINEDLAAQRAMVPALLIPMDASGIDPRQRLHPATLRNPTPDLLPRLATCEQLLRRLVKQPTYELRTLFEAERTNLCGDLLTYGATLRALREITTRGESFPTAALRLLGHLPRPLQSLLDMVPQKIDVLNEIVKGAEVLSNIGRVARSSSLRRFASSRDDGDTKLLIWGVMADAGGRLVVTLRDFRPHVAPLLSVGHLALAELLAADFLHAYTESANGLVKRLQRVLGYK